MQVNLYGHTRTNGRTDMAKKGTTRYFSSKQEEYIAKLLGGRTTANSGADNGRDKFVI